MNENLQRQGEFHIHDSTIAVWEEHYNPIVYAAMYKVMLRAIRQLTERGWTMQPDARIAKQFPTLKDDHWEGRRGVLELRIQLNGRSLEIMFFQNVIHENRHGGQFDFQKMKRMAAVSRTLRIACLVEMKRLADLFVSIGYRLTEREGSRYVELEPSLKMVRDLAEGLREDAMTPLERFNRRWGADRFERDATGWPSAKELSSWHHKGEGFAQGAVFYTRDRSGRLARGQVFEGINGMWTLYANGVYIQGALHPNQFFHCEHPEREPRRVRDHRGRLKQELNKAVQAENFARVATLGKVLARCA